MTRATTVLTRSFAILSMVAEVAACGAQATPSTSAGASAPAASTAASVAPASAAASSAASAAPSTAASGALNIAYWDYGPAAETGNQSIADGFMKDNPGVTVSLTPVAGENWGGYYANLATLIASGKKPDIAFTASEGIKFLAQTGLVVPVNQFLDSDPDAAALKADIAPALLQSFGFQGDI